MIAFSIFGIAVTWLQLLAAVPQIIALLVNTEKLIQILKGKGASPDEASSQAWNIAAKQMAGIFAVMQGIPHPHPMTKVEEQIWFDRATGNA